MRNLFKISKLQSIGGGINKLTYPTKPFFFVYLLLLNLATNFIYFCIQHNITTFIEIVLMSFLIAYCESVIFCLTKGLFKKIYSLFIAVINNLLILTEFFLFLNFHMVISHEAVDIIADTNTEECKNFIESYLGVGTIILFVCSCIAFNFIIVTIAKHINKLKISDIMTGLSFMGFCLFAYCVYGFVHYGSGMNIPMTSTLTRSVYAIYRTRQKIEGNKLVRMVCENLKVTQISKDKPTIVVIIGESYSVYHSSLYGYKKNTNPLLKDMADKGELYIFDNAITLHPATTASMYADFSLDSLGYGFTEKPLFPACFKKAGYYTAMYDNQYFVGEGLTFLCDKELSKSLYDFRNNKRYTYDEDMVKSIVPENKQALYIIHLWGQHYTYKDRYPKEFNHFKPSDYDERIPLSKREIIAHYDNATLYNDFVVKQAIKKFSDKDCCILYFSDHGEEIYDLGDFMGHGTAEHSSNPNYQLRVPLMVWMSSKFKQIHPKIEKSLINAKHFPISMDDISHTIIDIAGIYCKDFSPTRSFVNKKYDKNRKRIVLNSIDYDKNIMKAR